MNRPTLHAVLVLLAMLAPASCGRRALSGPPELHLGRDECAECGMMINEDRCSAAALVDRDGRAEYVLFDDIGCLLDYERSNDRGDRPIDRFVHDYHTRRWVSAGAAAYLVTSRDKIATPMGSGIVAFAERSAAEAAVAQFGGRALAFEPTAAERKSRMDARLGRVQPTTP